MVVVGSDSLDGVASTRPTLIVVSGLPATGKTTLSALIAAEHALPVISRDRIKEHLFDDLAPDLTTFTRADSARLGLEAAVRLLRQADEHLRTGTSLIVDSNFHPALAAVELEPFFAIADVRQVHCRVAPDELYRRYRARYEGGGRHPVHLDGEVLATWGMAFEDGIEMPIPLDAALIEVRTDTGYEPSLDDILGFAGPAR